jgi:hypothetical protein
MVRACDRIMCRTLARSGARYRPAMAGEITAGKRTLIERHGNEFELPEQHTVELQPHNEETWVSLNTPQSGSLFVLRELEQRDDAVVVHLGAELGRHGPPGVGRPEDPLPEATGYPFPSRGGG